VFLKYFKFFLKAVIRFDVRSLPAMKLLLKFF